MVDSNSLDALGINCLMDMDNTESDTYHITGKKVQCLKFHWFD